MYFFKSIDEAANLFGKFNEKPTYYYHYAFEGVSIFNQVMEIPAEVDLGATTLILYFLSLTHILLND